ncbi:MAG TPA: hypothetical protein VFO66_14015 [Gemmatimonadaceae bacterium]|nr:hypothetical protein [Gemmatimonadaceae bacterium]
MAKMTLDQLVTQLKGAFGPGLRSVVLYGSAAVEANAGGDQNVLVIVDALDVMRLEAMAATVRAWSDAGNPPPFTLTMAEWRRSADVFPMEYSDILERHRILYGEPPFEGIRIQPGDLRWQLELETMGKLLHLRQGVLAAGGDGRRQLELLAMTKSTILVLFRATLRLHGMTPSHDSLEVVRAAASVAGFDPAPFERVIRHTRKDAVVRTSEAPQLLAEYVRGVEQLVAYLDQHAPEAPTA